MRSIEILIFIIWCIDTSMLYRKVIYMVYFSACSYVKFIVFCVQSLTKMGLLNLRKHASLVAVMKRSLQAVRAWSLYFNFMVRVGLYFSYKTLQRSLKLLSMFLINFEKEKKNKRPARTRATYINTSYLFRKNFLSE